MKKLIISLSFLIALTGLTCLTFASEYGILRPGGIPLGVEREPLLESTSVTDTLTWRSSPHPEINFGFGNPGDSMLVWFDPPAPCQLIAVRFRVMNFEGHPLIDIWDASNYDPLIYSIDSTDANGWWGSYDPITCGSCWIPGLSDHSPLGWDAEDPTRHFWGPFPYTITSHHENAWVEIPADLGIQGQVYLSGDPIYLSSPFYITDGWGFAMEYPRARPFPFFKYYAAGTGPDGIHDGWFIRSYFPWFEIVVKYFENTPPKITNLTHHLDTYDPGPYPVTVNIEDHDADNDSMAGVAFAELFYTINGSMNKTSMTGPVEGRLFSGEIPEIDTGDKVKFWVEAVDLAGDSSRTGGVTFSRLVPDQPESDILIIWDRWSDPAMDSFYVDLFSSIEQLSGIRYEYELWNIHNHMGIDSSILNWGWNTIIVTGMKCDHTLPGRDMVDNPFVDWLESGTSENPHNLLYIDQDYFRAHREYGNDWDAELSQGDLLHDYFGVSYAVSDKRGTYPSAYDSVAVGVGDFEGIRINFFPDVWDPTYPQSNVWPDWIVETTEDAEQIFYYKDNSEFGAGVRLNRGHYKTVYFPWQDFFAVDSLDNGDLVPRTGLTAAIEKILEWFGTQTILDVEYEEHSIPGSFSLSQNYPNPFNVCTDIRYEIIDSRYPSQTSLKIFNILGQEVKTLVDEFKEPGIYTIRWDGKDDYGADVSSGVYFYQIRANDFTESKRMVLLK